MIRRHRDSSPAAPRHPLEDDDLLQEILLRLPPQPSSLPRATAVCKRWRSLATDLKFIARFRAHHQKPPLLGVFHRSSDGIVFVPVLDPPDRIPAQRFDLVGRYGDYDVLGCRHGRVLAMNWWQGELLVCDPVLGEHYRLAVPSEFRMGLDNGAILCPAAIDQGHVHDSSCHFKLVLMTMYTEDRRPAARVYSSETGAWADLVKTDARWQMDDVGIPGALVGNAIYWLQLRVGKDILAFDMDEQSLTVFSGPTITNDFHHGSNRIIQAENGAVGLAVLSYPRFRMWQRNVDSHGGVATWILWKTVEMHSILGLPRTPVAICSMLGYCEDSEAFFIYLERSIYRVQLNTMQSKRLHETDYINYYHPFTSFYTPGIAMAGEYDGAELQDM